MITPEGVGETVRSIPRSIRHYSDKLRASITTETLSTGFFYAMGVEVIYGIGSGISGHSDFLQVGGEIISLFGSILTIENLRPSLFFRASRAETTIRTLLGLGSMTGYALFASGNYDLYQLGLAVSGISTAISFVDCVTSKDPNSINYYSKEEVERQRRVELGKVLFEAKKHDPTLSPSRISYLLGVSDYDPKAAQKLPLSDKLINE